MAILPTNCFICKNTWTGAGAICDACTLKLKHGTTYKPQPPPPPPQCGFCGGPHYTPDCLAAALHLQALKVQQAQARSNMPPRKPRRNPYTNYAPPLKCCLKCKGNYLIESKAGNVCSNCRAVVHNPCRNCTSQNTKGIAAVEFSVTTQFIECQDCLFIE